MTSFFNLAVDERFRWASDADQSGPVLVKVGEHHWSYDLHREQRYAVRDHGEAVMRAPAPEPAPEVSVRLVGTREQLDAFLFDCPEAAKYGVRIVEEGA